MKDKRGCVYVKLMLYGYDKENQEMMFLVLVKIYFWFRFVIFNKLRLKNVYLIFILLIVIKKVV